MVEIRRFEERCLELGRDGEIAGSIHLCLGQEAIPVGACAALEERDRVLSTYRGHGWALAAGVPVEELLGEIAQRAGGVNGGRGGSPYLIAPDHGFYGENSIVGAGVPIAAGVALASSARDEDRVVLTSIGDGAMSQGAVHEGMVFAAARKLPLLIVCEHNGWAEMTPSDEFGRIDDLVGRAAAYGISGVLVDGNDPEAVRAAVADAAASARAGGGPALLVFRTARLSGHYNRDIEHYRSKADREAAVEIDPIVALRSALIADRALTAEQADAIDAEAQAVVDAATAAVLAMDAPDPATARDHVYAPAGEPDPLGPVDAAADETTYVKAVTAALRAELESRPETLVYGEDVGFAGGIFGATRGLQEQFGAARVFDTPIAENAMLGAAVGAAMTGMRPIVEIMWADFLLVALDQLINQAANVRYLSSSKLSAPLVVRTQQGVTPGSCAQHSQNLEALLAHIPGLRVGLPATPQDAYDMLRAAVADPDPTIVIEARALYQQKGPVREDGPPQPAAGARVHREGEDVAIFSWGAMVPQAIAAGELLEREGIAATVVDLRWLSPLDEETIARVVRAAGNVVIAHEANVTGGFGAELSARITAAHFDYLDAPVVRVGTPDVRMPSAPALQQALVPDAAAIARAATATLKGTVAAEV